MIRFPHLMQSLDLGFTTLPNRMIMGSMHLGLEESPGGFERMAAFYGERARGGVGLMVTGGIAPNAEGRPFQAGAVLSSPDDMANHRLITEAVHREGGRILLQILHFGRYAEHPDLVAPSAIPAPINRHTPRELDGAEVEQTVKDYARTAKIAREIGYDGVEIMGSEGYLINSFLALATNTRRDEWGGEFRDRAQFPLEIVRRTREEVGHDFIVMFRQSMLDLVPGGSTLDETRWLAEELEKAGVNILNTGIGWHESRVPTIATSVPRAAFAEVTALVRQSVGIPVVTGNRINTPEVAEELLTRGVADMVSLARPLLADPLFPEKVRSGHPERINTCIGCNQGCIDHTFSNKISTCLVNPRAGHETLLKLEPTRQRKRIGVVGAGPAGISFALNAARRGHEIVLHDEGDEIGGQFNLARRIPGKEEFAETLRYFRNEICATGIELRLGTHVTAAHLTAAAYDELVLATGVTPRRLDIEGADHPTVVSYLDVLRGSAAIGRRVAIIGAGGIGFDVAVFITQDGPSVSLDIPRFFARWGVDPKFETPGAIVKPHPEKATREVYLLQRKSTKVGAGLGVTTGWIHRAELNKRGVTTIGGVIYRRIDDSGLRIEAAGQERTLAVDTVIVCAGQEPRRDLHDELAAIGVPSHVIGGAHVAAELDAKRAIRQGIELANTL
ncbi:FAD-dependent oxidoreductase [Gordonia sihwensis]|uniref:oxidoreductase n=1 Tax=Gordonia sihwensis TaxID=173559 RepID=UPI003D98A98D